MDHVKASATVQVLSNAIGFPISVHPGNVLMCTGVRALDLGGLQFSVDVKIVSSCVSNHAVAVILRVLGNLGLLMVSDNDFEYQSSSSFLDVFVVDFAKTNTPEGILERGNISDPEDAIVFLQGAIITKYLDVRLSEAKDIVC